MDQTWNVSPSWLAAYMRPFENAAPVIPLGGAPFFSLRTALMAGPDGAAFDGFTSLAR